jgi:soluble lytic murein transglycosylase-like protein
MGRAFEEFAQNGARRIAFAWLLSALVVAVRAQTPASPPKTAEPDAVQAAVQSGMAAALVQQRASVLKQVSAVMGRAPVPAASFFTAPWVESPVAFNLPPCDALPTAQLEELIETNSKQAAVKPELIRAVISEESGGRPCAVSSKGAQGLMQLMPATADQFGVKDPFDPKQNVEAGTKLLKQLLDKYHGDTSLALSAYNAGEDRVDRDGKVPSIPETMNYLKDILTKLPAK